MAKPQGWQKEGRKQALPVAIMLTFVLASCREDYDHKNAEPLDHLNENHGIVAVPKAQFDAQNAICSHGDILRACIVSDFDRQITIEISNISSDPIRYDHSHFHYPAVVTVFSKTGEVISGEPWAGSPIPDQQPILPPGEALSLAFDGQSIGWVSLDKAGKICYAINYARPNIELPGGRVSVCTNSPVENARQ